MDWLRGGNALEDEDAGEFDEVGITMCALSGIDHLVSRKLIHTLNIGYAAYAIRTTYSIKTCLVCNITVINENYSLHDWRIEPFEKIDAKVDCVDPPDVLR